MEEGEEEEEEESFYINGVTRTMDEKFGTTKSVIKGTKKGSLIQTASLPPPPPLFLLLCRPIQVVSSSISSILGTRWATEGEGGGGEKSGRENEQSRS